MASSSKGGRGWLLERERTFRKWSKGPLAKVDFRLEI